MKRVVAATFLTLLLAGCGGSAPESTVDPAVRAQLGTNVDAVKTAAAREDRAASEAALAVLTRNVAAAQSRGGLDAGTARSILAAADRVAEDVRTLTPPPPVVVTVTPPPPQPTSDEPGRDPDLDKPGKDHGKDEDSGKGHDSGKGQDGGDGGDGSDGSDGN